MALFRNFGVNRRNRLCGVHEYASAQFIDFLELAENCTFLDRKFISALNETADGLCSIRPRTVSFLPLRVKRCMRLSGEAAQLDNLFPGFRNAAKSHPFTGRKPSGASALELQHEP
jgi:hypothetical protein